MITPSAFPSNGKASETVVEYALRDVKTPIQVSEYRTRPLPKRLRHELLPTAEIEAVLRALPMPDVPTGDPEPGSTA